MAGVIQTTIAADGGEYFAGETLKLIQKLKGFYLPQVTAWIQSAENLLSRNAALKSRVFTSEKTGLSRPGVEKFSADVSGGNLYGSRNTLEKQWGSIVDHAKANTIAKNHSVVGQDISSDLLAQQLLIQGYSLLTKIGEVVRNDSVHYKIVLHTMRGMNLNRATEWDLTLGQFLNNAAVVKGNGYELRLDNKTNLRKNLNMFLSKEWDQDERHDFELFMKQVMGYFVFAGKKRNNDLAKQATGVNRGQLLEAYLQLGFTYRYRQSGNKADWQDLKHEFQAVVSVLKTLEKPSAFWQGGEGGPNLTNIQLKTNGASIVNLNTLVRQMSRTYAILYQLDEKVSSRVKADTLHESFKFSDEEAIEALIEMFDRDGWHSYVTINI